MLDVMFMPWHNVYMIRLRFLLLSLVMLSLSACSTAGFLTGAAAVTGISAAQEGGLKGAFSDTKIELMINEAWFQYNVDAFRKLQTTVKQGRVLITGVVQDPDHRVEAVRLAWRVPGVTQVINEIQVAESAGIKGFVKDTWITSRLRTSLTFDRAVQSINYNIDTVKSVVYLMGVAQDQAELNHVIEKARVVPGVQQVVSYVTLPGDKKAREESTIPKPEKVMSESDTQHYNAPQGETYNEPSTETPAEPSISDQYYNS